MLSLWLLLVQYLVVVKLPPVLAAAWGRGCGGHRGGINTAVMPLAYEGAGITTVNVIPQPWRKARRVTFHECVQTLLTSYLGCVRILKHSLFGSGN